MSIRQYAADVAHETSPNIKEKYGVSFIGTTINAERLINSTAKIMKGV
jgi:hypothetical protein